MWLELAAADREMRAAAEAARRLERSMSAAGVQQAKHLAAQWAPDR